MVSLPEQYPWSSYRSNALGELNGLLYPHPLYLQLGLDDRQRQRVYHSLFANEIESNDLEGLRSCLQSGTPLGDERFRSRIEQVLKLRVGYAFRGRPAKIQV